MTSKEDGREVANSSNDARASPTMYSDRGGSRNFGPQADDLATAIREVLAATPEHLSTLGQAGRARVKEKHDVDIEAGKLAQYLRDFAGSA